jgi:hypothetical protein
MVKGGRSKLMQRAELLRPREFSSEEWGVLSFEDREAFVRAKKDYALGLFRQYGAGSIVGSLLMDLAELETKVHSRGLVDEVEGKPLSREYVSGVKLKVELAKALRDLMQKDRKVEVTHRHVKDSDEGLVLDGVDFSVIGDDDE